MADGGDLKERLTQRLSRGTGPDKTSDRVLELTTQLVQAEDARRKAEEQLDKAITWVRFLRERKLDRSQRSSQDSAASEALQKNLGQTRERLEDAERALRQARDHNEELDRTIGREREARQLVETELEATRQRLKEASVLLTEIEEAYITGQTQRIELR